MGKGQIIGHIEGGRYNVKLIYAYRSRIEQKIATAQQNITAIDARIAALDVQIAAETDQAVKERLILERSILNLQKISVQKQIEYYQNNMPADPTVEAWCMDMTEDLTGDVGTAEIPGEPQEVLIRPGYSGRAVYSGARDGQLMPSIAGEPNQVLFNWMLLPGWQRHKPIYRLGTISAIDYDANTCTVCLDPAYSSQQSLPAVDGVAIGDCGATSDYTAQINDFCSRNPGHPFCTNADEGTPINLSDSQLAQLQLVNYDVNFNYGRLNDKSGFRMGDSWDVMGPGGQGDCEDFALTKMQILVDSYGWNSRDLKIVGAKTKEGINHAMLGIVTSNRGLVLLDVNYDQVMESARLPYRIDQIAMTKTAWKHYTRKLEGIAVEYMNCNAIAFTVGDRVVVEFPTKEWTNSKVIGFEENPERCTAGIVVFPAAYAVGGQTGVVRLSESNPGGAQVKAELIDNLSKSAAGSSRLRAIKMGGATVGASPVVVGQVRAYNPIDDSVSIMAAQPNDVWYHEGFSVSNLAFYAFGLTSLIPLPPDAPSYNTGCKAFDHSLNSWASKTEPGSQVMNIAAFSIGQIAYAIDGFVYTTPRHLEVVRKKYDGAADSWSSYGSDGSFRVADYFAFSILGKGYFGAGVDDFCTDGDPVSYDGVMTFYNNKFRQYDPAGDSWSLKATPFEYAGGYQTRLDGADGTGYSGFAFGDQDLSDPDNPQSAVDFYNAQADVWYRSMVSGIRLNDPASTLVAN